MEKNKNFLADMDKTPNVKNEIVDKAKKKKEKIQVNLYMRKDLKDELQEAADEMEVSVSTMGIIAVKTYLMQQRMLKKDDN